MCLSDLAHEVFSIAKSKGFHDTPREPGTALMLIVTEVAEAMEDVRNGRMATTFTENGKPVGFGSELADILIRVLDTAVEFGVDIEDEVRWKLIYNQQRPHKHGKLL